MIPIGGLLRGILALVWLTACGPGGPPPARGERAPEAPIVGIPTERPWYRDADRDGFGDRRALVYARQQPPGFVRPGGYDCNDDDPDAWPGAPEICDGNDQDCDGTDDRQDTDLHECGAWFPDADGDGYGDEDGVEYHEGQPQGWIQKAGDCDDTNAAANPMATDVCGDGVDQDCDRRDCGEPLHPFEVTVGSVSGEAGFGERVFAVPDVDGDGRADAVVSQTAHPMLAKDFYTGPYYSPEPGATWLISSSTRGDVGTDAALAVWKHGDLTTDDVVGVGDLDGGGAGDLWIACGREVHLLSGETRGEADLSAPIARLSPSCEGCTFDGIAPMPDADGDGVAELALVGPDRVWVVPGATRGLHGAGIARAEIRFAEPDSSIWTRSVGDVDGDGLQDAVASGGSIGQTGTWELPDELSGTFVVTGPPDTDRAGTFVALGDLDGDGHDDFAIGNGEVEYLMFGEAAGLPAVAGGGVFAHAVAAGDLDGDGLADLVSVRGSEALVVYGPAYGAATEDAPRLGMQHAASEIPLGWAGVGLGDTDGDGRAELAVTMPGYTGFGATPRDTEWHGPGELWILSIGDVR